VQFYPDAEAVLARLPRRGVPMILQFKRNKTTAPFRPNRMAKLVRKLADGFGLPVSTTHVLSSGVAGTMVANGSGMQWSTVRSIALAWVLTLPAAMIMSGLLYVIFRQIF